PLVRGLVLGILGAFAGGGVVVGSGQSYAKSLRGGDSTFFLLFAVLFIGLGVGIVAGPRLIGALSRRRWFGLSIVLAAAAVTVLAVAAHLSIAMAGPLRVGEGAGKSTQVDRLAARLRALGHDVVVTREPGSTEAGVRIRDVLLHGSAPLTPRAEALLYAADRAHHVATVVRPALARGAVVVCERYVDSSLAYLEAGRTLPVDEVAWLSGWATGGLKPDLVVLLDLDPAEGLRRAAHRPPEPDPAAVQFAEKVRYAFLDRAAKDPKRYLVLDASRPVDSVATLIVDRVERVLPPAGAAAPAPSAVAGGEPEVPPPDAMTAPLIAGVATT